MERLRSLIKEVLTVQPKKDCNCGCGGCAKKSPVITENRIKKAISEGLTYHVENKIPLHESVYRIGSEKHFALINEARKLWTRGLIDVSEDDQAILETHLGNFGLYETVNFEGEEYDIVSKDGEWVYLRSIHDTQVGRKEIKVKEKDITINEAEVPLDMPMVNEGEWPKELTSKYSDEYRLELEKVSPTYQDKPGRAKYRVIDIESGELKATPVFEKPESLMAYADDLIKPQGGTQSSNFGESLDEEKGYGADTAWKDEEGNKVTLEDILDMTKNIPQKDYPTEKLAKVVLNWDDNPKEVERIDQVEVSKQYPILIMVGEDEKIKWILDGNHRAQKALRSKSETIPAKLIKPSNLSSEAKKILLGVVDESLNEGQDKWVVYDTKTKKRLPNAGKIYKDRKAAQAFADKQENAEVASDTFYFDKIQESLEERINTILEAKKKNKKEKKDPPLNKPKRGGSKAYYVYVRDPKTKKIKKVSFGSGGLRAKIKNKEARKRFASRHNCDKKKDRTTAGYWSCNLPRYAEQLGLGSNMSTFW